MRSRALRFIKQSPSEGGQAMVEYALILALITVVSMTALTIVGETVQTLLDAIAAKLAALAADL